MRMIRREYGRTPRQGMTDNEPRTESRDPPLYPAEGAPVPPPGPDAGIRPRRGRKHVNLIADHTSAEVSGNGDPNGSAAGRQS